MSRSIEIFSSGAQLMNGTFGALLSAALLMFIFGMVIYLTKGI